jgi:molybdopterin-guanine dinucleotide biosynthesis protein A
LIAGAVLAGGKSLRFGKNKALQQLRGRRFVDLAVESLHPFCEPVMLVVGEIEPYLAAEAMLVQDVVPHQGPLGGIYTALLYSPAEWVLVKATDMPFLVPQLVSLIIGAREGFDAVVPIVNGFYEPLLALYNRSCLPAVKRKLGEPDKHQVIGIYRQIKVKTISETEWREVDADGISFKNINTPSDLAEIDGLAGS